ncbi:RES family NAD+ phosphorylase [Geodermatophilus sp. CPCC 205506]|uniref:RES family NAD+ phosphorylase n=1 Tax=Geodermatophilus sp. CPCC 205506 TaxID=2936596 RepID=UPI003F53D357
MGVLKRLPLGPCSCGPIGVSRGEPAGRAGGVHDGNRRLVPYREPPSDLPGNPTYVTIPAGESLFRIHLNAFAPTQFNPNPVSNPFRAGRFDSTAGDFSYLYAAQTIAGAVAEVLLRDIPESEIGQPRLVPLAQVRGRRLSEIRVQRPLRLVDLTGPGAHAFSQDSWLTKCDGVYYPYTQHWAKRIREWCPDAVGLLWRSRIDDNETVLVLFGDRVTADALIKWGGATNLALGRGRKLLDPVLAKYNAELSA